MSAWAFFPTLFAKFNLISFVGNVLAPSLLLPLGTNGNHLSPRKRRGAPESDGEANRGYNDTK